MYVIVVYALLCISGFILFTKAHLISGQPRRKVKVSVIIPARNEEKNIAHILGSLTKQTRAPDEIIVVDDFSTDSTNRIAREYSNVRVLKNTLLPEGWTGKNWAVWNGYLNATGDVFIFLDADVRLAPGAIEALLNTWERVGGAMSVIPFHQAEEYYERLSMVFNILGLFTFTSRFEKNSKVKGLYGPCIVVSREDYEKVGGHGSVKSEVLDDISLGKRFSEAGVKVNNFIGGDLVLQRMYPDGLRSEIEGFSKSAVQGMENIKFTTVLFIAMWILGLITVEILTPVFILLQHPLALYFLISYLFYTAQVFYFISYTGNYGRIVPLLHIFPSMFFIFVFLYALYNVKFRGTVLWRGREIQVGGRKSV